MTSEPEKLLPEAREFFALECEKHGFDTQAAAVRAGNISYEDGGQVCIDAMIAFARHRLSSPVSGTDKVMVPEADAWQPPSTAPKDGTVLELVVDYTDGHSPLQDATLACTIGWNDFDNTGDDKWHIVGWDWCHDHIRDGAGTIRAWRPSRLMACDDGLPPLPQTAGEDVRNG